MYSCLKTSCLKSLVCTSAPSEVSGLDLLIPKAENAPNDALGQNLKFSRDGSSIPTPLVPEATTRNFCENFCENFRKIFQNIIVPSTTISISKPFVILNQCAEMHNFLTGRPIYNINSCSADKLRATTSFFTRIANSFLADSINTQDYKIVQRTFRNFPN